MEYVLEDVPKLEQRIKENKKDLAILNERMNVLLPEQEEEQQALATLDATITTLQQSLRAVEDEMFGELSKKLKTTVSRVREVHRHALSLRSEQASRTTKLNEKILILKSEYELKKQRNPTAMLEQATEWLTTQENNLVDNRKESDIINKKVKEAQENVMKAKAVYTKIREEVASLRSTMNDTGKTRDTLSKAHNRKEKNINILEQHMAQLRQDRHDILQKAKVDSVELPLLKNKSKKKKKSKKKSSSSSSSSSSSTSTNTTAKKKGTKRSRNSSQQSQQSQPTGTDLSSSSSDDEEDSEEEVESEEEEDSEMEDSSRSGSVAGSSTGSMSSTNSSQYSGAFDSSQARHVRNDAATMKTIDFSKLNKDIKTEWKKLKSNASSGSRRSRGSSTSSTSTSSRMAKELLNFVEKTKKELQNKVQQLSQELDEMQPNSRASEHLAETNERLKEINLTLKQAKEASRLAAKKFNEVKKKRLDKFLIMYNHVKDAIGDVYRAMTKSAKHNVGGEAHLLLEDDSDEPYLSGIKYNTLVPGKRFRDMEQLSGGERVSCTSNVVVARSIGVVAQRIFFFHIFLFGADPLSQSF